ncbi:MAG: hypothetical protein PHF00_02110 [Elusimicrobia bacterium]|nr:hypothetical protein [Elusimicrobiota bacterium]
MNRLAPLALALALGGCVTIADPMLSSQSIAPGQRTILAVYPGPGTWVVSESESKAEAAAMSMPLLSTVAQSLQDERDRKMSEQFAVYIPPWKAERELEPILRAQLEQSGFPGRIVPAAQSELDAATLRDFNRSPNALEWQRKYYYGDPSQPLPRDYSRFLALDDALILEANLLASVAADDDGNMAPTLSISSRLIRCQTNRLLWRHEDKVSDAAGARSLNEFATLPQQLIDRWKALLPQLAAKTAESLRAALGQAPAAPAVAAPAAPASSSGYPQAGQMLQPPPGYPRPGQTIPPPTIYPPTGATTSPSSTQALPWSMPAITPAAAPPGADGPPASTP